MRPRFAGFTVMILMLAGASAAVAQAPPAAPTTARTEAIVPPITRVRPKTPPAPLPAKVQKGKVAAPKTKAGSSARGKAVQPLPPATASSAKPAVR